MKQTALLCALALVMVPFATRAQSVTDRASIEWGPIRDQKKDGFLSSVAHSGSHGYHLLVWRKRELALQLMDKDLRMVAECPLPLEVDRKEHKWLGLVFVDDKVHFFSSCYDRSGRTNTLYVRTYAQRDLSPIGTMRPLHTISALRKDAKGDFRVDDMGNDRIRVSVHIPIDDD
ncbi:MAG TPA: hypothetical protein VGE21_03545, partial [Flavobacteriales bacterium]